MKDGFTYFGCKKKGQKKPGMPVSLENIRIKSSMTTSSHQEIQKLQIVTEASISKLNSTYQASATELKI